ncbi:ABC transporter ATP-binding protein [Sinorhizobium meliloti]|uniref:ABC transporter ATP-binding protein n=1 Tax=Rhizobium meliloti TaxID=382 RepID=UPI0003DC6201|nr:ABC transporter ATP-binding protein [Sinorhizobium meliloti]ARS71022.1 Fe3+/spermidine/putrescine ABC transporter ATP-binding protein [Sinorhizobium meliloti RU11/001]
MSSADIADIHLVDVTKSYGSHVVVNKISLVVPRGEFVSILGPSGCGKTTTLNMVAGFQEPSSGEIRIRGENQVGVPPEKRNIGLVFQNYALFPHMTVGENVAFGLKMKRKSRAEIEDGVRRALRSVHLEGYETRYPKELSGGQQQRTALARAIAPQPSVLLLDEPLSNLDLKLREAMRIELKEIQQALAMTFVYVTHDQEEAMAMSDRVVVMSRGVVAQEGRPVDIYQNPASAFVADFIGKSNLLAVKETEKLNGQLRLTLTGGLTLIAQPATSAPAAKVELCCIRPENVQLAAPGEISENLLTGRIDKVVNLGAHVDVWVDVSKDCTIKAQLPLRRLEGVNVGSDVRLRIEPKAVQPLTV